MSGNTPIMMYGAGVSGGVWDPDEMKRRAEDLRRDLKLEPPTFTFPQVTLADLEKRLADALDRIAALERKSKRGRKRK